MYNVHVAQALHKQGMQMKLPQSTFAAARWLKERVCRDAAIAAAAAAAAAGSCCSAAAVYLLYA
jgi:hypothetical protein